MNVFFCPTEKYGSALDVVRPDGRGLYSGKTLEEFKFEYGDVTIVDQEIAIQHDRNRRITAPVEISEERFHDMLECLPPAKWHRLRGAESFHISERIAYDIVDWFVRIGDKFYNFADTDSLSAEQVVSRVLLVHLVDSKNPAN